MQGPLKAPIKPIFPSIFFDFSGPYGPIWARMGPYGPGPGPWRAGKVQKNTPLLSNIFFSRIVVFDLQTTFFDRHLWPPDNVFWSKNRVLQVSGPDTLQNATKITSKTKFSTPIVQIPSHLHPALSYSLYKWTLGEFFSENTPFQSLLANLSFLWNLVFY